MSQLLRRLPVTTLHKGENGGIEYDAQPTGKHRFVRWGRRIFLPYEDSHGVHIRLTLRVTDVGNWCTSIRVVSKPFGVEAAFDREFLPREYEVGKPDENGEWTIPQMEIAYPWQPYLFSSTIEMKGLYALDGSLEPKHAGIGTPHLATNVRVRSSFDMFWLAVSVLFSASLVGVGAVLGIVFS